MKNGFFFFFFFFLVFHLSAVFFFFSFSFHRPLHGFPASKKKNCKRNVFCYSLTAADSQADLRKRSFFSPFFFVFVCLCVCVCVCVCVCGLRQAV